MRGGDALTVVKLGGSYAFSQRLKAWLEALASCAGSVVVVPGGGPFADAVRAAQARMGFDDRAAHHMALLAMAQYGCALESLGSGFVTAASSEEIARAVRAGRVPIWSPLPMTLDAPDLPAAWEVTSDSLAVWLARTIGAGRVVLVKHVEVGPAGAQAADLAARGILDAFLPGILGADGPQAYIAGPSDHATVAAAIRAGAAPGKRIEWR